tara:strand:- start:148 stop:843 length:696 start_codon:yes stop_codon:yes gene_type:complete
MCAACKEEQPKENFSGAQIKKKAAAKCKPCVQAQHELSTAQPQPAGAKQSARAASATGELQRWISDGMHIIMLERSLKAYQARVPAIDQDARLLAEAAAAIKAVPVRLNEKVKAEAKAFEAARLEFEKAIAPAQKQYDTVTEAAMDFFGPGGHRQMCNDYHSSADESVARIIGKSAADPRIRYVEMQWAELDRDDCGGMTGDTAVVVEMQPGRFSYAGRAPRGVSRSAGLV